MILRSAAAHRPRGVTAIELIAAISVTSIVSALAYSAYRTHAVRAQVAAGIISVARMQRAVEDDFRHDGDVPASLAEVRIGGGHRDMANSLVASVSLSNGRIDVLYGDNADAALVGRRLSLTPYETATLEVVWICGNQIPPAGLQPLGFVHGGPQAVQVPTTIETRYLPPYCR